MDPAEDFFNRTFYWTLQRWEVILSFRIVAHLGEPLAAKEYLEQTNRHVADLLRTKPDIFIATPPPDLAEAMTAKTIGDARGAVAAASIVFSHSVLDDAVLNYCKVAALAAPDEWTPCVEGRKVELKAVKGSSYGEIRTQLMDDFFEELSQKSLLKKADLLFAKCRPPAGFSPLANYTYDKERLESFDNLRHEIIHSDGLDKPFSFTDADLDYLMKTSMLFYEPPKLQVWLEA